MYTDTGGELYFNILLYYNNTRLPHYSGYNHDNYLRTYTLQLCVDVVILYLHHMNFVKQSQSKVWAINE